LNDDAAPVTAAAADQPAAGKPTKRFRVGSLSRRMIVIAALWITALLLLGGFALDRVLTASIVRNFDDQLEYVLNSMIAASEIGPDGEVRFNRPPADQRFIEPYSGVYFQISGAGADTFPSRSLWDRRLQVHDEHRDVKVHVYDSHEFADEPLRVAERDVLLPGSKLWWRFQVAQSREMIDTQIKQLRATLFWSFLALGVGLLMLAALQTFYGLWPLRRVRQEVSLIRSGKKTRITDDFPVEIQPLTDEINQLLAHSEEQAEEARRHAGNLAHALKTPLTVITNAATAHAPDLADTVCREAIVMRRQVDHHLARARAIGRRASVHARSTVWESVEAVQRAVDRLYENVTVDITGDRKAQVRVERQDLDEMIGNLVENAAKYGGGRVFVTIEPQGSTVDVVVEDDGRGIAHGQHSGGFGMTSMQERAERIGASLTIVTAPRSGTEVVLAWEPSSLPTQVYVAG